MQDYLLFRLYGPLASWGELAVGEVRPSAPYPSRSALLGLLAAALGITREDEAAQARLDASVLFGVKLSAASLPLRDYHTVQWPDAPRKFRYRTRQQEMRDKAKLNTILSRRQYHCDCLVTVAVCLTEHASHTLAQLAAALQEPAFALFLGRRACPPALPLDPKVASYANLKAALDSRQTDALLDRPGIARLDLPPALYSKTPARYYWDERITAAGMDQQLVQTRHDQPLSRTRWQFAPRQEHVYLAEAGQ
ncbi:type I-E CRISPR-associated protein Cas5/CasD [Leeia sp.]|uniref:type I-E CRISPR-associated protein Cas5/CasD n=1 Tax=Leeia sp. TaxID=2884678 RepID=UPI0035B270C4